MKAARTAWRPLGRPKGFRLTDIGAELFRVLPGRAEALEHGEAEALARVFGEAGEMPARRQDRH